MAQRRIGLGSGRASLVFVITAAFAVAVGAARLLQLPPAVAVINTITLTGPAAIGAGLQDVYRLELSEAAPVGGVDVLLETPPGASCVLAPTEAVQGGASLTVSVPPGKRRASFVVQSEGVTLPQSCDVTASAVGWTVDPNMLAVTIVQGRLRIRRLVRSIGTFAAPDPFFVEVGVPTAGPKGLRRVQRLSKGTGDVVVTACSDAPAIGTIVDRFGNDGGNDGCEDTVILSPYARSVPGDIQFAPVSGDPNDNPLVSVTAPGFSGDNQDVSVRDPAVTLRGPETIGRDLQAGYTATLSEPAPADLTITISVPADDASDCLVAETGQSFGAQSIQRVIPAGRFRAEFVVQGATVTPEGDPCDVQVDAGTFGTDTISIDVVEPGLRIRDLSSTVGVFDGREGFFVELGVPNPGDRRLDAVQALRKGTAAAPTAPLEVMVVGDNAGTGTIVGSPALVYPGSSRTVPNDLAFVPVSPGAVRVRASALGFVTTDRGDKDVVVAAATLKIAGRSLLGSGLQDDYTVRLVSASGHPDTVVTVESLTPDVCLVAPTRNTEGVAPGDPDYPVTRLIRANDFSADFVVSAASGRPDATCAIHAAAPAFEPADFTITLKEPGIQIRDLRRTVAVDAENEPFFVEVGVPNADGTALRFVQQVRKDATATPVVATVCSSDPTVGTIVDVTNVDNGNDGCEAAEVLQTFTRTVPGALKFQPIGVGSTMVDVTAPGFRTMSRKGRVEVEVVVATASASVRLAVPERVGSGLQVTASVKLQQRAGAGGVPVTLTVGPSSACLLAPDPFTEATGTALSLVIPEGSRRTDFVIAALEGLDEVTCTLTATSPGRVGDEREVTVQQPALQLHDLPSSTTTATSQLDFGVQIGVPTASLKRLAAVQAVRIGGVAVPVTVCSDDPSTGMIAGADAISGCLTKNINPGESEVTFTLLIKGLGMPTVFIKEDTVPVTNRSVKKVTIGTAAIGIRGPGVLGAGLQDTFVVVLGDTAPAGGVAVNITADPAGRCLVAASFDDTGAAMVTITVPEGQNRANFAAKGVFTTQEDEEGECRIVATAPNFLDGDKTLLVKRPALAIRGLSANQMAFGRHDEFVVDVGVPDDRGRRLRIRQPVDNILNAPLPVTVCSSDPNVGTIDGGMCATRLIQPQASSTDRFAFEPQNQGTTLVQATSPGIIVVRIDADSADVEVKNAALNLIGPADLGLNLQDSYRAVFSKAPPDGTTVTVTVENVPPPPVGVPPITAATCGLGSSENDDTPELSLVLPVPNGRSRVDFWIQGLKEGDCDILLTTDAPGFGEEQRTLVVHTPGVQIRSLARTRSVLAANDPFAVQIGVPAGNLARLALVQEVRPNNADVPLPLATGIPLQVCSSMPAVGQIAGDPGTGCVSGTIEALHNDVGFAFDPRSTGDTVVDVREDGFPLVITERAVVPITVAAEALSINGSDRLGAGLEDGYRVVLSTPATAAGTVTVTSMPAERCLVSADAGSEGGPSVQLPIAQGRARVDFTVQGIEGKMGECALEASVDLSGYENGSKRIDVVVPALRIVQLDPSLSTQSSDKPFAVRVGIPQASLRGLSATQAARARALPGAGGVSVTMCSSDTDVGQIVGVAPPAQCTVVQIPAGQSQTAANDLAFHIMAAGSTVVSASAPGFIATDAATQDVVVATVVVNINGPAQLGAGLEDKYTLKLSAAVASQTTFTITVADSSVGRCQVSSAETAVGQDLVAVSVGQNRSAATLFVHGMEGAVGVCELSATTQAPGITAGLRQIDIVRPGLRILNLNGSSKTGAADDVFLVQIGVPGTNLRSLKRMQQLRAGSTALPVMVCSSNEQVASINGMKCATAPVLANAKQTARGALALQPLAPGSTVVTAAAPGFIGTDAASKDVSVNSGAITLSGPDAVASGLQDTFTVKIDPAAKPGGVPVELVAETPTCQIAPDEASPGNSTLSLTVAAGKSAAKVAIQGVSMGVCRITLSSSDPAYTGELVERDIVQAAVRLRGLGASTTAVAANDGFFIDVGVARGNLSNLRLVQSVPVGAPLTVEACSSKAGVGVIVGAPSSDPACAAAEIQPGESGSAKDALQFDPLSGGPTTVSARVAGFLNTTAAAVDVDVAAAALALDGAGSVDRVGAGLMDTFKVLASGIVGTATPVTVTSHTPGVCQVADSESALPATAVTVTIAAGTKTKTFAVHGVEDVEDTCELVGTAAGFAAGSLAIPIVPPGLRIGNLSASKSAQASDDKFNVNIGVPKADESTLRWTQKVRTGSAGFDVTVCSSEPSIGAIVGGPDCLAVVIVAGKSKTLDGALKFDAIDNGVTVVEATAPNAVTTGAGSKQVTVTPSSLEVTVPGGTPAVGAGLQAGGFAVTAGQSPTQDTAVTITTQTPAVCAVAAAGNVAGGPTTTVTLAASSTVSTTFWVQGVEGAVGQCTLVATAIGYSDGSGSVDVVTAGVRIINLDAAPLDNAADDPFDVEVGVPSADQATLAVVQQVRAGSAGLVVTVTNANATVAQLKSATPPSPAQQVTVTVAAGSATSAGSGLAFDPLVPGGTTVEAVSPGLLSTDEATQTIVVQDSSGVGCS